MSPNQPIYWASYKREVLGFHPLVARRPRSQRTLARWWSSPSPHSSPSHLTAPLSFHSRLPSSSPLTLSSLPHSSWQGGGARCGGLSARRCGGSASSARGAAFRRGGAASRAWPASRRGPEARRLGAESGAGVAGSPAVGEGRIRRPSTFFPATKHGSGRSDPLAVDLFVGGDRLSYGGGGSIRDGVRSSHVD